MAKTFQSSSRGNNVGGGSTTYDTLSGWLEASNTEANMQMTVRSAGTFGLGRWYINSNGVNAVSTATFRKNTANGTIAVSITALTTGYFTDAVNTDAVVAGDLVNWKLVTGGTGADGFSYYHTYIEFSATTNTVQRYQVCPYAGLTDDLNNSPVYFGINGGSSTGEASLTLEAPAQFQVRNTGTLKNGGCYVSANSRLTATALRVRVNAADSSPNVSITALTTGAFEDNAGTVTLVNGDKINWKMLGGAEITSLVTRNMWVEHATTDGTFNCITGNMSDNGFNVTADKFWVPGSNVESPSTEVNLQTKVGFGFTASNLQIYMITNTGTPAGTFSLRLNGVDSALSISVTAGTTGFFEDTTDTVAIVANDLLGFYFKPGSSQSGKVGCMGMKCAPTVAAVVSAAVARSKKRMLLGVGL